MTAARGFDGVDIADEVRDSDIRRGELFHVAVVWREIRDRRLIAVARDLFAAAAANGSVGIVTNLAAGNVGRMRIKQRR